MMAAGRAGPGLLLLAVLALLAPAQAIYPFQNWSLPIPQVFFSFLAFFFFSLMESLLFFLPFLFLH